MPALPTTLRSRWIWSSCSPCCGCGLPADMRFLKLCRPAASAGRGLLMATPASGVHMDSQARADGAQVIPARKVKILLVDDTPENLVSLEAALYTLDQDLVLAHSGREALLYLLEDDFAAILL